MAQWKEERWLNGRRNRQQVGFTNARGRQGAHQVNVKVAEVLGWESPGGPPPAASSHLPAGTVVSRDTRPPLGRPDKAKQNGLLLTAWSP